MTSRGERRRRAIVVALASFASLAAVPVMGRWAGHGAAEPIAWALAEATDDLGVAEPDADAVGPTPLELAAMSGALPVDIPRGAVERVSVGAAAKPGARRSTAKTEPILGILVRADVVRAAIARGGRPSGSAVAASGDRPAGIVLQGVSGYGTALRDGDLLTRIGGTEATSEGRVIAAVSGAVRSRAKAIDGEIWRAGRRIPFVVELPRSKKRRHR